MMRTATFLTLAVLVAASVYFGLLPQTDAPPQQEQQKALIGGDFTLTDQHGNTVSNEGLKGTPRLVFFGFTHCPMICPTGLASMSAALEQMGAGAPQQEIQGIFITVDPARDTVEQINTYLQSFPGITGLTGSEEQIQQAVAAYRVYARKVPMEENEQAPQSNNNYDMNHSSYIYLMDAAGDYVTHFPHTATPEELIAGIHEAL